MQQKADANSSGQHSLPVHISVDPRTELMSLLWRLAGRPEYTSMPANAHYINEITEHFGPFREHPCVKFVSTVQQRFGAPMALAVHLTDTVSLKERVPFDPIPEGILRNWGPDGHIPAGRVAKEARRFVADTDFNRFCQPHEPLFRETESRYRRHIESEAHLEWFSGIFGHRPGVTLHVVLCLQNDGNNYPALVQLGDDVEYYCFIGTPVWDERGVPVPGKPGSWAVGPIVHELLHLYLVPQYGDPSSYLSAEGMREAGERLLESVSDRLNLESYGEWWCVIDETLTAAWHVRYMLATRGREAAHRCAAGYTRQGFTCTPALAELLAEYENDRARYPDFASFIPRLVEFFRREAGLPEHE